MMQRFAVYFPDPEQIEEWPTPGDRKAMPNPLLDEVVEDAYYTDPKGPFQHLIFHNPRYGFWVRVDFPDVVMPDKEMGVGNFVGSSVRQSEECAILARLLELPLDYDPNDKRMWHTVDHPGAGPRRWQQYGLESFNLLRLYQACRKSLELGAAIYLD